MVISDTMGGLFEEKGRVKGAGEHNSTSRTRELHSDRWVENYLYYGPRLLYNSIICAL